jgi:hypothetical protein
MSYEACFSPEFWLAEGEPYDAGPTLNGRGNPVSVYSAILLALQNASMRQALLDLAGDPRGLATDDSLACELLTKAYKVNTVSNLDVPVRVWLEPKGWVDVAVYEADHD